MPLSPFDAYVHPHPDRYVVAQRDGARYTAVLRPATQRITGCGSSGSPQTPLAWRQEMRSW